MIDAREYLQSFRKKESKLQLKLKQLHYLQGKLYSISLPAEQEHVIHTKNVSVMADTIAIIVDMQREINQQTYEIMQKKHEAYMLLDKIKPENAALLLDHYFDGETILSISQRIQKTKRQTQRRMNNAVAEFQAALNEE